MFPKAQSPLATCLTLIAGLAAAFAAPLQAQTATNTVIAIGPSAQGIVQAGDGNFYAPSPSGFVACQTDATMECAYIYQITPAGVVTAFHSFQPISTSTGPTAPNADGLGPTALIVGIDGNLYGACRYGGPGGGGTIFEIPLTGPKAGILSLLASFSFGGAQPDPGIVPSSLIQTADGSFYFTNGVGIYQLVIGATPNPVITRYTFPIDPKTLLLTNGGSAPSLTEGSDGDLYMPLWTGPETTPGGGAAGGFGDFNPKTGGFRAFGFPSDGSEGIGPDGPLVEGPDGEFYGVTKYNSTLGSPGVAFKVSSGSAYTMLHPFTGGADGARPNSALFVGSDDNFYGTTLLGGDTASANCKPTGCGTVFQLTPGGTLTTLHTFEGGTPTSTVVSQNPQVDGAAPEAPLVQANDGTFYGTSLFNVVFKTTLSPALPPPVQLTFNKPVVPLGTSATLTWKVLNAYSNTAQLCGAVVQGGATGAGNWSGVQTGTLANGVYSGSATITPTKIGNYTYALVCGGREAGFATLNVPQGLLITPSVMPQATVNVHYSEGLFVAGGTGPYTWLVSNVPTGLTLDSLQGIISGTPKQFGNVVLDVTVVDSATPANKTTAAVPMSVASGLQIKTTAAIKGTVGANYLQSLNAIGGLPPYLWSLTAGTLPDGLQLILGTGAIIGMPTTVGSSTVTFQVADNEGTPATETVQLAIKIVPSIQIAAVEFTQAIQEYQVLDDLMTSISDNGEPPVPMVSGKFAAMRVYFTNVKDSTDVTLNVTGGVVGQRAMNLPPDCPPDSERIHKNNCPSMDFYFTPMSGEWTAVLTLSDDQGNQLEQETLHVTSRDTASVYYKGVSICSVPNQPSSCQSADGLQGLIWFAQKILPTNNVHADIIARKIYRDPTKFVFPQTGLPDPQSWEGAVVGDMNSFLYQPADTQADADLKQYTDYVGVYSNTIDSTGMGWLDGHALMIPNQTSRQGVEAAAQVLAHETGHTLNLPHTGVQVPPGGVVGTCWGPGAVTLPTENQWIYNDDYIRTFINGYEYGFDPAEQTVIAGANVIQDGASQFDVMAYCMPRWISPFNYKNMVSSLGGGQVLSPDVKGGKRPLADQVKPKPMITYAQGSYWSITGSIPSTGIALDPIFTETMVGTSDPGAGTYSIQEQGAGGQVLYTRYFNPGVTQTDTTGTDFETDPEFAEYIPVTVGTTALAVLDPTGTTLTSVAMAGAPPTVAITSPATGFVGSGDQIVSWTATSATAASFTSRIYYSIDGGTTWQAVLDTTDLNAVLDFNTLPGAPAALIRVDVSDGVNTGSATSASFSVPRKTPTSIVINNPVSGVIQPAANPVFLAGGADDPDDGALTGKALQWSDSVQGILGTGSPLTVSLEPGTHTITLTATDSDGNPITATTEITLGGAPPVVGLTTAQVGTNCYNATISAAPGNQGANLTVVNYSLDDGNTYSSIPLASLPFTFPVSGTGTVTVVALAVDASGQVWSQSQPVNMGTGCNASTLTPGVTVTPSASHITSAQALSVSVAVIGVRGKLTPTGSVVLSSGSYISAATPLSRGTTTVKIAAGALAAGSDTLTATYTPDANSSSTYTSATGTSSPVTVTPPLVPAVLSSPAPGTTLTGLEMTFSWNAAGGATGYSLWVGTTGAGSHNVFDSGETTATSVKAALLPTQGETVYVRLYTIYNGVAQSNDYTFTASARAAITAPAASSTLTGPNVSFTWTAATGAGGYSLWLGASLGAHDLYDSGETTGTTAEANGLPANGQTIYARINTNYDGRAVWFDTTYTAATAPSAALTSPLPGTVLAGAKVTLTWSAAAGATGYSLWLGTTQGAHDLYNSHLTTGLSATASGLPANGATIYARLYSNYNGVVRYTDYTYTAAP